MTVLAYIFGAALFAVLSLRPASKADWTIRQIRIRMRRVGPTACLIVAVWVVLGAAVAEIRSAGPAAVETA